MHVFKTLEIAIVRRIDVDFLTIQIIKSHITYKTHNSHITVVFWRNSVPITYQLVRPCNQEKN